MQSYKVPVIAGTPPTFAAPALSDTVQVGSTLIVRNASAGSITVTLITPGTVATGDQYPDKAYTVAAGGEAWIPVLKDYRDSTTGTAAVTFSAVASVTAAAIVHS